MEVTAEALVVMVVVYLGEIVKMVGLAEVKQQVVMALIIQEKSGRVDQLKMIIRVVVEVILEEVQASQNLLDSLQELVVAPVTYLGIKIVHSIKMLFSQIQFYCLDMIVLFLPLQKMRILSALEMDQLE